MLHSTIELRIGSVGEARFKSIREISWKDIPMFAVLTGRNGAGKSQLLELLAYKLTGTRHQSHGKFEQLKLEVIGDQFAEDEVVYVPHSNTAITAGATSIAALQNAKRQAYDQLQHLHQIETDMRMLARRKRLERMVGHQFGQISVEKFVELIPDDFAFMLEDSTDLVNGLMQVFMAYRLQRVRELELHTPNDQIVKKIGIPPWDALNEILQAAEFPYHAESPLGSDFLTTVYFKLIDNQHGNPIDPDHLSSGEKVLMHLALWLYNSKNHGRFPRLLLLDEPDAHLHPSMTRQFMNVVQDVLVRNYDVRVIMTTHSPSTVALAPEGAIFEMSRGEPEITRSISKARTVGLLTAGLVVVSATTRMVLVEDESDVTFYSAIRDILSDFGPSKDPMAILPAPSIIFLPASIGRGTEKLGGGKSVVQKWVEKFDAAPFDELVRGVVDRDSGNIATDRIFVIQRYSIENYLLDPFAVFALLIEQQNKSPISEIEISGGDEHLIRGLEELQLQSIIQFVRQSIEPLLQDISLQEQTSELVEFTNGKTLNYPNWMISRRGHDLLPIYQSAFGQYLITPPRLIRAIYRVRLIAKDLASLMSKLQSG
jgi:energy-coupling factor transporter ATP-binding protein EcfA2